MAIEGYFQEKKYTAFSTDIIEIKRHIKAFKINIYDLIKDLREQEYSKDKKGYSRTSYDYINYDLLIIDEIGVQFSTDAERQILYDVFDRRYEAFRPTFLISNLELRSTENQLGVDRILGARIIDRSINSKTKIIRLKNKSWR